MRSPLAKNPNWTLLLWILAGYFVYPVIVFWFLCIVTVGPIFKVFESPLNPMSVRGSSAWIQMIVLGALVGLSVGWLQQQVLRVRLVWPAPGWVKASALGGAIGLVLSLHVVSPMFYMYPYFSTSIGSTLPLMLPLILPIAVAQWWVLRRVVRDAWLWVVANVLGAMCWAAMGDIIPFGTPGRDWLLAITMPLVQAAVTGMAIVWLFERHARIDKRHPSEKDKARSASVWDDATLA